MLFFQFNTLRGHGLSSLKSQEIGNVPELGGLGLDGFDAVETNLHFAVQV